jgi:hypothetical protein
MSKRKPTAEELIHGVKDAAERARMHAEASAKFEAMVAAHTPGPWELFKGFVVPSLAANTDCRIVGVRVGGDTAWIPSTGGTDVQEANARLIAAAPDLLAALEGLVRAISGQGRVNLDPHDLGPTDVLVAARAAIAKARGES